MQYVYIALFQKELNFCIGEVLQRLSEPENRQLLAHYPPRNTSQVLKKLSFSKKVEALTTVFLSTCPKKYFMRKQWAVVAFKIILSNEYKIKFTFEIYYNYQEMYKTLPNGQIVYE